MLGQKIIKLRREKMLTQAAVAEAIGVSQTAYHKWESDETKPSVQHLMKLADFFGVQLRYFLSEYS